MLKSLSILFPALLSLALGSAAYGASGTIDFIQYWAAFQQFSNGLNPYDVEAMFEIQNALGRTDPRALMMWNPPWLLTLLYPILSLEFLHSANVWLVANLVMVFLAGFILLNSFNLPNKKLLYSLFPIIFFLPLWYCIWYGQVSVLLMLGICVLFFGLKKESYLALGIGLMLISIKPHIFYLPLLYTFLFVLKKKEFKKWVHLCWPLGILILTTLAIMPNVFGFWPKAVLSPESSLHLVDVTQWKVATLIGFIKAIAKDHYGITLIWPMYLVPLLGVVWFLFFVPKDFKNIEQYFSIVLAVSFITSPYGWFFDFSVLAPVLSILLLSISEKECGRTARLSSMAAVVLLQFAILFSFKFLDLQHHFFWVPIAVLIVFLWGERRARIN